jgi:hypothetical protein
MALAADGECARQASEEARQNGWEFDRVRGDWRLLKALLEGDWSSDDFLVVERGRAVEASYDECILRCSPGAAKEPGS